MFVCQSHLNADLHTRIFKQRLYRMCIGDFCQNNSERSGWLREERERKILHKSAILSSLFAGLFSFILRQSCALIRLTKPNKITYVLVNRVLLTCAICIFLLAATVTDFICIYCSKRRHFCISNRYKELELII